MCACDSFWSWDKHNAQSFSAYCSLLNGKANDNLGPLTANQQSMEAGGICSHTPINSVTVIVDVFILLVKLPSPFLYVLLLCNFTKSHMAMVPIIVNCLMVVLVWSLNEILSSAMPLNHCSHVCFSLLNDCKITDDFRKAHETEYL